MSNNALKLDLPEALRKYVDQLVKSGEFSDAGEYLRALIRRDREDRAKKDLRQLIEHGRNSGPARTMTMAGVEALKHRALNRSR